MIIPKRPGKYYNYRDYHGVYYPNNFGLDWAAWSIHTFLIECANWADSDDLKANEVSVSYDQLALWSGMTKSSVRRVIHRLKELEFIVISSVKNSRSAQKILILWKRTRNDTRTDTRNDTRNQLELLDENNDSHTRTDTRTDTRNDTTKRRREKKKIKKEILIPPTPTATTDVAIDLATIWNTKLPSHTQNQISLLRKNSSRITKIQSAIDKIGFEELTSIIETISKNSFLCGENDRRWKPDFLWVLKIENYMKVKEGKYSFAEQQQTRRMEML
jgi:hypothetical protein